MSPPQGEAPTPGSRLSLDLGVTTDLLDRQLDGSDGLIRVVEDTGEPVLPEMAGLFPTRLGCVLLGELLLGKGVVGLDTDPDVVAHNPEADTADLRAGQNDVSSGRLGAGHVPLGALRLLDHASEKILFRDHAHAALLGLVET